MLKISREFSRLRKASTQGEVEQRICDIHAGLKSCSLRRDPQWGRRLHAKAVESAVDSDICVATALVRMYAKCGRMAEARCVFDRIHKPDAVSWNALLLGYAENGKGHPTLELFSRMKADERDSVTYVAALKACTALAVNGTPSEKAQGLKVGRGIHLEIGCHLDLYVQNTLIDMYAKCGTMVEARRVFDSIQKPSLVSWNALLLGYAENGEGHVSLQLFSKLKADGYLPDSKTFVAVLKACTSLAVSGNKAHGLETGSQLHLEIGCHLNSYVRSTLIDMYAKCGNMLEARRMFDGMQKPDVVSWTALVLGYAENGEEHVALELFSRMKADGCVPNSVTYVAALKACASIGALAPGRQVHSDISEFNIHVVTRLVDFYAKCGSMVEARAVFDRHTDARDIATWTALLSGYSSCGDTTAVFNLFEAMQEMGFRPDGVTFVCMLLCCSHAGLVKKAMQYLEAMAVQYGVTPDVFHYNCMVDALGRANQVIEAVRLLRRMPCSPDAVTWSALLAACRKWKNLELGRMAFQSSVEMNRKDVSSYVLMAHIYGSLDMWDEQVRVLQCGTKLGAWKQQQEHAYVADEKGKMVKFVAGEADPPELEERMAEFLQNLGDPDQ